RFFCTVHPLPEVHVAGAQGPARTTAAQPARDRVPMGAGFLRSAALERAVKRQTAAGLVPFGTQLFTLRLQPAQSVPETVVAGRIGAIGGGEAKPAVDDR